MKFSVFQIIALALIIFVSVPPAAYAETTPLRAPAALPTLPIEMVIPPVHIDELDDRANPYWQPQDRRGNHRSPRQTQRKKVQFSALEKAYKKRIGSEVQQFGYDLFTSSAIENDQQAPPFMMAKRNTSAQNNRTENSITQPLLTRPAGAVQDHFILNSGDKLDVIFRGQRNDRKTYQIDSSGLLIIDGLKPVAAAGRRLGELRAALEHNVSSMIDTQIFLSLSSVTQAGVLIMGHVENPGKHYLTSFHSVIDALAKAGGIKKNGSLRRIKLVRAGKSHVIDLYDVLINGNMDFDLTIRNGDRIIVPPIGATIAITGSVANPAIYELPFKRAKISLKTALKMSGGTIHMGVTRPIWIHANQRGRDIVQEIDNAQKKIISAGDILKITAEDNKQVESITLSGHTRKPGLYALNQTPALSSLLSDISVLGEDIYPLIAILKRQDRKTLSPVYIPFAPYEVINKNFDLRFESDDEVTLFSHEQIRKLKDINAQLRDGEKLAEGLSRYHHKNQDLRQSISFAITDKEDTAQDIVTDPDIAQLLMDRLIYVRGAVRNPGPYPVGNQTTLDMIINVSGGLTHKANLANIEVTSAQHYSEQFTDRATGTRRERYNLKKTKPESIVLDVGDAVRVNDKFDPSLQQTVDIIGEVRFPGRYDLLRGDTFLSLIERAGGLTEQAYPEGAILSRASERRIEQQQFEAAKRDLDQTLAAMLNDEDSREKLDAEKLKLAKKLSRELSNIQAVGRITFEADPAILRAQPELDILLENKDKVYVPKRPLNVRVVGEILSPATLQFRKDKDPRDYIRESGGFTYYADKDRSFVVYPNGSSEPLQVGPWNHRPVMIPPGSTIVVPRDPKPFDFIQMANDVTNIFKNIALTGIFIDEISDDEN